MDPIVWVSPIDAHAHYTEANRAGCAVCNLQHERDRHQKVAEAHAETIAHLQVMATQAIQHRFDDEPYEEGNAAAWEYVARYIEGRTAAPGAAEET